MIKALSNDLRGVICIVLILLLGVGCSTTSQRENQKTQLAAVQWVEQSVREQIDRGDTAGALTQLREAKNLTSNSLQLQLMTGEALVRLNRLDEAERQYFRAMRQFKDNPEAVNNLALVYREQEQLGKSVDLFRSLVNGYPDYVEGYKNLADSYWIQARQSLVVASQTLPDDPQIAEQLSLLESVDYNDDTPLEDLLAPGSAGSALAAPGAGDDEFTQLTNALERARNAAQAASEILAARNQARLAAIQEAKREAAELASRKAAEREVAEIAAKEAAELAAQQQTERDATKPAEERDNPLESATATDIAVQEDSDNIALATVVATPISLSEDATEKVFSILESWARAWSSRDAELLFAHYARDFTPAFDMSLPSWEGQKRAFINKAKFIDIQIEDLELQQQTDNAVIATFTQRYQSDRTVEASRKTLQFSRFSDGRWLIQREDSKLLEEGGS